MLVMPGSPRQIYDKIEGTKGKKLVMYLIPIFILFVFVGFTIGNLMPGLLRKDEEIDWQKIEQTPTKVSTSFKGKVVYTDPNFYPQDDIRFYLESASGETIILLSTSDEKLTVVEGLNVLVFGEVEKTESGNEDVLIVEKVVVKK